MRLVLCWILTVLLFVSPVAATHVEGSTVIDHDPNAPDPCDPVNDPDPSQVQDVHITLINPQNERHDFDSCPVSSVPCGSNQACVSGADIQEGLQALAELAQDFYIDNSDTVSECVIDDLPCTQEGPWELWLHTFHKAEAQNRPRYECDGSIVTDTSGAPVPNAEFVPHIFRQPYVVNYEDEEWCRSECGIGNVDWREETQACCGDDIAANLLDSESDCGLPSGPGICGNTNLNDDGEYRWIVPGEDIGIIKDVQCSEGDLLALPDVGSVLTCGKKGRNNFLTTMVDLPGTEAHGYLCRDVIDFSDSNNIETKAEIVECAGEDINEALNGNARSSRSEPELVGLPFCTKPGTAKGDVDGDGDHDVHDVRIARWMLANDAIPADVCCVDVNEDGVFTDADIDPSSGNVDPGEEESISDIKDSPTSYDAYKTCSNVKNRVGKMYYCTRSGQWHLDLDDLPGQNCIDAGEVGSPLTREVYTGTLCCSEENDFPEYYNDPLSASTELALGGCWQSTFVGDAEQVDIHDDNVVSTSDGNPILNIGGEFLGCSLPEGDVRLSIRDSHTQTGLVQNLPNCATIKAAGSTPFEFVCEYDGGWDVINHQLNRAKAEPTPNGGLQASLKEALPGFNIAINPNFEDEK